VSWVEKTRWEALTTEQQEGYPPLAPDFVIELVSPSDLKNQRYEDLQAKMQEYLKNEVKLGWLIEPKSKTVEIYRLGRKVEKLKNPSNLSGEDVLVNFSLNLSKIFV
ncbi:MAG: Uma2 family endonuclease, partial [Waterburya sp.]